MTKTILDKRKLLISAGGLLAAVIAVVLWRPWQGKNAPLEAPPPADLNAAGSDPDHDPNTVPSFREAKDYLMLARKRPLTKPEVDRVMQLAEVKYSTTAIYAMTTLAAVNLPDRRSEIIAIHVRNLRHAEANARATAIAGLGNMNSKEHAAVIVPFMKSQHERERSAAKISLRKLGFDIPKDKEKDRGDD